MTETATTDEVKKQLDQFRADFGRCAVKSVRSSWGFPISSTTR